ncbi:MAG: peptidylprolyl isomerase [Proteobacteria bacterium]|nr:peptidylprolyl isomerase [Pseudomonadota bacterium]MDA1331381.1 peptidylprolyl isomerase [Pseudomonadota bacterium]
MNIEKDTVVSLAYELFDLDGKLIEKTSKPIWYLHGGYQGIFEVVEKSLDGKSVGDTVEVKLDPAEAFGDYDESLVHLEPVDKFPGSVEIGMEFEGYQDEGQAKKVFRVTDTADGKVVVDGNHPLAGLGLMFRCNIESIRAASAEEVSHGHVHGAGGHHH